MNTKNKLKNSLAEELSRLSGFPLADVYNLLEAPKNKEFGELSFPCFGLAKLWKLAPPACAEKLSSEIILPSGIESAKPVGPFLNFRFDRAPFTTDTVTNIRSGTTHPLSGNRFETETVVIDYSSPNIAKPFHVGHLRATLLGNSLDRTYRYLGFKTISVNHLGDWGTQFGFVWAGCELWGKPANPSVKTLVELYRRATSLKDEQTEFRKSNPTAALPDGHPDVNEVARAFFLDLEGGKPYAVEFWQWCSDISLQYLKTTYERLGIKFDHYTGESFYSDKIDSVRNDLEKAGILKESEGALGVELGEKEGFARVFSADGRSLYLTRDLATAKYRAETFCFDRALYVVGMPQALHFQQLKGVLRKLNCDYADKLEHVAFGHVIGMKTRGGGEIVELNDFLDEAFERSLEAYHAQVSKRPDGLDERAVAEAVSLSAIIFSNLSRSRTKDVHFSWEHALEFQGDSGPYLLYAFARINGINEKASTEGIKPAEQIASSLLPDESAFQLALVLDSFGEVLSQTIAENEPAHLAAFALDVSKAFSKAYNELQVLGVEKLQAEARLALFDATRKVLKQTISLLGFSTIERM